MNVLAVGVSAVLVAGAALLWSAPVGRPIRSRERNGRESGPHATGGTLAALACGVGAWVVVGGATGVVLGVGTAVACRWLLRRVEPAAVRRERELLVRDLPAAIALVASALAVGRDVTSALGLVGSALGGPAGAELLAVRDRLALGIAPETVWREVGASPHLGTFGRTVGRSVESGASVAEAVAALAEELEEDRRAAAEAAARRVAVRAALPMGVCLLPAFVLVGVVPMTVGLFTALPLLR